MNKTKVFITFLLLVNAISIVQAQDDPKNYYNPLYNGAPSLSIVPDARGSAMGDAGAATEPDVYSQHWNPAKYAFAYSKAGIGVTYTPWLTKLGLTDMYIGYLAGYYKLGDTDRYAVSSSIRYFSIGSIQLYDEGGSNIAETSPYEAAVDVGYSMKLTENLSLGGVFRYIYSDLGTAATSESDYYPGSSLAADLALYYNNYLMMGSSECLFGLGMSISNMGPKISYGDADYNSSFLPTNLKIGGSFLLPMDDYNTLSLNVDANKLMIPTPPDYRNMTAEDREIARQEYNQKKFSVDGMFKSLSDAPGGALEEFREITWSFGAEYAYDNKFFVRGGYFYESPYKGNRQYFSVGAGVKLQSLQIDVSYLISTVPNNPLDQTLRFSLCFDMDGLRGLMR